MLKGRHENVEVNMKKMITALLLAVASLTAPMGVAQNKGGDVTDMQALRAAIKSDKKAFVASTMNLTPAEAKRFWPIYDAYQRSVDVGNQRRALAIEAVVAKDQTLSSLYARNLANELIANEETEIRARRTLHNRLMRALPPNKAARYLQLESKIRAVRDYDIATTIPLIK
jgi:Spy/CpxP family protein refolding chaperone